jgi:hypothetical protein
MIAEEVREFSQLKARNVFGTLERFGATLTSDALLTESTWPYVKFADFQVLGMLSNQATGAHTITVSPLVWPENIDDWTRFSVANQDWMATAHARDRTVHQSLYEVDSYGQEGTQHSETERWNVSGIVPYLWSYYDDDTNENTNPRPPVGPASYYAPVWQRAPAADFHPDVNMDLRTIGHFNRFIEGMLQLQHSVRVWCVYEIDEPLQYRFAHSTPFLLHVITEVIDATYLATNYENRFDPKEQTEPHSYLLVSPYPNCLCRCLAASALIWVIGGCYVFLHTIIIRMHHCHSLGTNLR